MKTVFVLGAGASKEVNLPTGLELKAQIAAMLNFRFEMGSRTQGGDDQIFQAVQFEAREKYQNHQQELFNACRQICDSMPLAPSIDNFIDVRAGDERIEYCGKLGITASILKAEQRSLLYIDPSNIYNKMNFDSVSPTWFGQIFSRLFENCTRDNLEDRLSSVGMIIFNYDRCFEHFLYHALQNYYSLGPQEAARLVCTLQIHHPYGTVGQLPWQHDLRRRGNVNPVEYGGSPSHFQHLRELSRGILTFTEGTDFRASEIEEIRQMTMNADRVVFLGFAFHPLNLKLLFAANLAFAAAGKRVCFGTAKGISDEDRSAIKFELAEKLKIGSDDVKLLKREAGCADLFHEFHRTLSFV